MLLIFIEVRVTVIACAPEVALLLHKFVQQRPSLFQPKPDPSPTNLVAVTIPAISDLPSDLIQSQPGVPILNPSRSSSNYSCCIYTGACCLCIDPVA